MIMSNMTLHHVRDIEQLFSQFYNVLAPQGYLCIADLDLEDGQFHHDNTGVFHFGFDRKALRTMLERAGFDHISETTATEMARQIPSGETRTFTIFLISCQKR
jgi:ubiquinone/menaquinone biosynthesis C-methylase UbiE